MVKVIIGLILIIVAIVIASYNIKKDKVDSFLLDVVCLLSLLGMNLLWGYVYDTPKHSKNYIIKTEIHQQYVDGKEIETDTVYIFKKK